MRTISDCARGAGAWHVRNRPGDIAAPAITVEGDAAPVVAWIDPSSARVETSTFSGGS
jgi:hypothetical protein